MEVRKKIEIKRIPCEPQKKRQTPRSFELFSELTPQTLEKLDKVATSYSASLDANESRNILEEISQLLHLFTLNKPLSEDVEGGIGIGTKVGTQLTSVAQQVYFVLKVLTLQLNSSLISIDPEIIAWLVDKYPHKVPKGFRKVFSTWVEAQMEGKGGQSNGEGEGRSSKPSEYHQCVTFRSETDGRSNFPSQWDFHAFCKQRDLFYTIKRGWEEAGRGEREAVFGGSGSGARTATSSNGFKHGRGGGGGGGGGHGGGLREVDPLHPKIKALFHINSSWVNLSHLASLFTAQYLLDSMEESRAKGEEKDELLKVLKVANPDKFAKLHSRMSSTNEPEHKPKSSFVFQQYFISTAASPLFNQHLVDRIAYEIRQIEGFLDDGDDPNSPNDVEYQVLFKKAVLLAKLLGYLVFIPYRESNMDCINNGKVSSTTLDKQTLCVKYIEVRTHQRPILDLISILRKAIQHGRLTFTMPWIIEFLSCSDAVTLQLPSYREVIALICYVYQRTLTVNKGSRKLDLVNKNFLRFWCGKFFSMEVFPNSALVKTDAFVDKSLKAAFFSLVIQEELDESDVRIIDLNAKLGGKLLKSYFSANFKQMQYTLHSGVQNQAFGTGFAQNNAPQQRKHIRPIPAKPTPTQSATRQNSEESELQRQLECSFFDSNSPSVKKTVDFVSERLASNYVKNLRKDMHDQRMDLVHNGVFGERAAEACRIKMISGIRGFLESKCDVSISVLIGESLSAEALKLCKEITFRQASDKVAEWIQKHIKEDLFPEIQIPIQDESNGIMTRVSSISSPDSGIQGQTNHSAKPAVTHSVMILMHRLMKDLHEGNSVSELDIDQILNCTELGRDPTMTHSLVDFGITLIAYASSLLTPDRQDKLILHLWKPCWKTDCHILSPRNLMILNQAGDQKLTNSWEVLQSVVIRLIKVKMTDFKTVEQDCFRLLRNDINPFESQNISKLLRKLVSETQPTNDYDTNVSREVVDWVSWYCSSQDGEF